MESKPLTAGPRPFWERGGRVANEVGVREQAPVPSLSQDERCLLPVHGEPFGRSDFAETLDEIGDQDRLVEPWTLTHDLSKGAIVLNKTRQ